MPRFFHRSRALKIRFAVIFAAAFVLFFSALNVRFLYANVKFWLAPGTITLPDSLGDALKQFPLAHDITSRPLSDHARLVIDSLGIDAPIVFNVPADNDAVYRNLENGVVHYATTPKPGEKSGVSVVLGHSSAYPWYRGQYGSVFALLGKLAPGDKFYIQYDDGRLFLYVVKQSLVFNPFAGDARLEELENNPIPSVVLVSCYPVGTNYRRIAVQAEMIQI